jgi:hypothetical protein
MYVFMYVCVCIHTIHNTYTQTQRHNTFQFALLCNSRDSLAPFFGHQLVDWIIPAAVVTFQAELLRFEASRFTAVLGFQCLHLVCSGHASCSHKKAQRGQIRCAGSDLSKENLHFCSNAFLHVYVCMAMRLSSCVHTIS